MDPDFFLPKKQKYAVRNVTCPNVLSQPQRFRLDFNDVIIYIRVVSLAEYVTRAKKIVIY